MGDLAIPFLFVGGALVVFGPLGIVFMAQDARGRRQLHSTRTIARAALWSGILVYTGLALAALLAELSGPPPWPPPKMSFSGWTRLPLWTEFALFTNTVAVLWAWLMLRDEERHPDRAMVAAALAEERDGKRVSGDAPGVRG